MQAPRAAERGLVIQAGRLQIDVPRSLGYFGGVATAVTLGLIEPLLGAFIVAVPLLKMLGKGDLPQPIRFAAEVVDGAAQPVGGEAEGTVRLRDPDEEAAQAVATAEAAQRGRRISSTRGRTSSRTRTPRPAGS